MCMVSIVSLYCLSIPLRYNQVKNQADTGINILDAQCSECNLRTIDEVVNDATKRQRTIRLVILQHYVTAQN